MYILKNSIINILRNKGRNILIGIIIIVISAACSITLAIRNSADKIVSSYEDKYQLTATIGMNREALTKSLRENGTSREDMINSFNKIEQVSIDEIKKYGDSDYVSNYYYTESISLNGKDLEEATDSLVKETTKTDIETTTDKKTTVTRKPTGNNNPPKNGKWPSRNNNSGEETTSSTTTTTTKKKTTTTVENIRNEKAAKGTFTLIGYNSFEAMSDFISGNYTIIDGEISSDFESDKCVISEELATLNKVKVGDSITLVSPYKDSITYKLEVTGIYKENTDDSSDMKNMYSSSANTIITNVSVVDKIVKNYYFENTGLENI